MEASGGIRLGSTRTRDRAVDTITRRVIDSGRPVVVPQVSQEPALAPTTGPRRELTFIGVPILVARRPAGTLEIVLAYRKDRDYERSLEFYRVVASMIAQAVKVRRLVEADRTPADRRERAPPGRAARPLRLPQHHRQQRVDSAGVRAGRAGRPHDHDGPDPRRVRHRQGDDRARDPLQLAARQESRSSRSVAPRCRSR